MKKIFNILLKSRSKIQNVLLSVFLLASIFLSAILTIAHFPDSMDFGSFLASGQESILNRNPYTYDHDLIFIVPIKKYNVHIKSPNLNPPISILIFKLLAITEINAASMATTWKIISIAWYFEITYYLFKKNTTLASPITILWMLALAGFWGTIEVGQIYMPLITIVLLAWDKLKNDKPNLAGFLIGVLIAIKPQFIIWAIFLFFTRQRKVFINSMVVFVSISIIPLLIFGIEVYVQWIQAIAQYKGILLPGNTSLQSFAAHMGIPAFGNFLSAGLLLLVFGYVVFKKADVMQSSALALLCTLLASPYSWCGYTLFLLPLFFENNKWSWKKKTAAGLLAVPFLVILVTFATTKIEFILFGWTYGWAVILLLADEISEIQAARPLPKSATI